jgi:aminoglycoside phosphotransferase family enzyme/predicted kinase
MPPTDRARDDDALALHERRAAALREALASPGDLPPLRLDTHVSTVLVAAGLAYKLKRPVALPFVDLSALAVRRALCVDEVRLNRRLAPSLYLGVVPIDGPADRPRPGPAWAVDDGSPEPAWAPGVELAVLMRRFEQSALWSHRVPAGLVSQDEARALGTTLGAFHRDRAARVPSSPHGTAAAFHARALDNLETLAALRGVAGRERLALLRRDADARHARLAGLRDARDRDGFVRDGHGDLHLGNIVTIDGVPVPFDCLEFDAALRVGDVADELAFATMDLGHAGRRDLGAALLDGWLQETGDVEAVALLDDGAAYRAAVRAKVAAFDAVRDPAGGGAARCDAYLRTAEAVAVREPAVLVAMHGLSGSGKSVVSAVLAAELDAVRLCSDIERKRAAGLVATSREGARGALYAPAARDAVYARLAALARRLLGWGRSVVVDASFLDAAQRHAFAALADAAGASFAVVDVRAPEALMRARLAARAAAGTDASDADLAVLDAQLRAYRPAGVDEAARTLRWDATVAPTREAVAAAWRAHARGRAA